MLNIDTAKLNRIVNTYTGILDGLTTRMDALKGPLDEAYLSAPKFEAGVARAHGFGTRALEVADAFSIGDRPRSGRGAFPSRLVP